MKFVVLYFFVGFINGSCGECRVVDIYFGDRFVKFDELIMRE